MNLFKLLILLGTCAATLVQAPPAHSLDYTSIEDYLYNTHERTVSMDFTNAALNDVLKVFSQQSGYNFIATADVATQPVNLYFEDVPVQEALERILFANNLTYELKPESNIYVVKRLSKPNIDLLTKVFPLQFASVPSSKLNSTFSEDEGSSSSSGDEEGEEAGILPAVQAVLSSNGNVREDPRTNSLIVTDIPVQFPLIEQTIARLDVRVPQVLIEVEMLDVSKTITDKIGIKFGNTPVTLSGSTRLIGAPFNESANSFYDDGNVGAEEYSELGELSFAGLTATLNLLRTHSDTKNLARPRILTLNNQTAQIAIKTDEAIGLSTDISSSEGASASSTAAERVETGVILKVTPQANLYSREITMALEPKVIQARTGESFPTSNGSITFKDPEERGTKSVLRVYDGDTIIMGGLLRTDSTDTRTRVPGLANIPVIGVLARHKDVVEDERELIIFITPHIMKEQMAQNREGMSLSKLKREQDLPSQRLKAIDSELNHLDNRSK